MDTSGKTTVQQSENRGQEGAEGRVEKAVSKGAGGANEMGGKRACGS